MTWVDVTGIRRLYSCNIPPSDSIKKFERSLDAIIASARTSTLSFVIGGDFNASAIEWGSKKTYHCGRALFQTFAILELEIDNIEIMPTYTKAEKSSMVYLTFVDPRLSREGSYLQVSDRYTGSNHRAHTYQLHPTSRTANMTRMPKREKWTPATLDRETFLSFLEKTYVEGTAEARAHSLSRTITAACNISMSTNSNHSGRHPVYYWNKNIGVIRKVLYKVIR